MSAAKKPYKVIVRKGKGVLGKDGKPFAPKVMMVKEASGWSYPAKYGMETIADFMRKDGAVELQVIEPDNTQWRFVKVFQS